MRASLFVSMRMIKKIMTRHRFCGIYRNFKTVFLLTFGMAVADL